MLLLLLLLLDSMHFHFNKKFNSNYSFSSSRTFFSPEWPFIVRNSLYNGSHRNSLNGLDSERKATSIQLFEVAATTIKVFATKQCKESFSTNRSITAELHAQEPHCKENLVISIQEILCKRPSVRPSTLPPVLPHHSTANVKSHTF